MRPKEPQGRNLGNQKVSLIGKLTRHSRSVSAARCTLPGPRRPSLNIILSRVGKQWLLLQPEWQRNGGQHHCPFPTLTNSWRVRCNGCYNQVLKSALLPEQD